MFRLQRRLWQSFSNLTRTETISLVQLSLEKRLPMPLALVPRHNRFIQMIDVPVMSFQNPAIGPLKTITLPKTICAAVIRPDMMHWAIVYYRANLRKGLASSKNRGRVSGGGRKIYSQKGTGRARAGSSRAPQRRGGGVCFGPRPRDWSQKLPAKIRAKALSSALHMKQENGHLRLIDEESLAIPSHKTSLLDYLLKEHWEEQPLKKRRKILIVSQEPTPKNLMLASRALEHVKTFSLATDGELSCYNVLDCRWLLITDKAMWSLFP